MRVLALAGVALAVMACGPREPENPVSASGVHKANVTVQTNADGKTVEQEAYAERIKRDNTPGSIKHLYVISAYSGQVIIYSTVRGKVTSSGKRLTPSSVSGSYGTSSYGFPVMIGNDQYYTTEVLGDDGTYGSSIPYIYWFDTKGVYHQHYPDGGQIIHVSDQPLRVPSIILNMETSTITPKQ